MRDISNLKKLSAHLKQIQVNEFYHGKIQCIRTVHNDHVFLMNNNSYLNILPWFEEELDRIFPEDYKRNERNFVVHRRRKISPVWFLLPFQFEMTGKEFHDCFIKPFQIIELMKKIKNGLVTPASSVVAIDKFILLISQENKVENTVQTRKVLIEKVDQNILAYEENKIPPSPS